MDEVLHAPTAFGDHQGQSITVVLADPTPLWTGDRAVFFTNGWLYGDAIAVVEVSRTEVAEPAPAAGEVLSPELASTVEQMRDRPLAERVSGAELAVSGRVVGLSRVTQAERTFSEHDPDWWDAQIEVDETVKGPAQKTVTLTFPASQDVAWFGAHKPRAGEEGIWLLRRGEHPAAPPQAYTALHPLDFHPKEHDTLERLRALSRPASGSS